MRIRTLLAAALGATAGAGTMYLLDPVHGPGRRRELLRAAVTRSREGLADGARGAGRRVGDRARRSVEDVRAGFAAGLVEGGAADQPRP